MESIFSPKDKKDLNEKSDVYPTLKNTLRSQPVLTKCNSVNDTAHPGRSKLTNGQAKSPTQMSPLMKAEGKYPSKSKNSVKSNLKQSDEKKKVVLNRTKSVPSAKKQLKIVDASCKSKESSPDTYKLYLDKCDRDTLSKYATFPRKKGNSTFPLGDERFDDIMTRSTVSQSDFSPKGQSVWDRLSAKSTIGSSGKVRHKIHDKPESRPSSNSSNHSPSVLLLESFTQTSLTGSCLPDPEESELPVFKKVLDTLSITLKTPTEISLLENKLKRLNEEHSKLQAEYARLRHSLLESEALRQDLEKAHEILENERLARGEVEAELDQTSQKVELMLKSMEDVEQELEDHGALKETVAVLQERNESFQKDLKSSQILIVSLKQDIEKSLAAQKTLCQQLQETEAESQELKEFMQQEKNTLMEELSWFRQQAEMKELELEEKQAECRRLAVLWDSSRQELHSMEDETRSLLIEQGADMSGTAVSVYNLSNRVQQFLRKISESKSHHDYLTYWESTVPEDEGGDKITGGASLSEQVTKLTELVGQLIKTVQKNLEDPISFSDNKENITCGDLPTLRSKIVQLEDQVKKLKEDNMRKEQIQEDLKKSSSQVEELKERYSRNQRIMHDRLQKSEKECRQMDSLLHKVTAALKSVPDLVESTPMLSTLWLEMGDGPIVPKQLDKTHILTINGEEATYV